MKDSIGKGYTKDDHPTFSCSCTQATRRVKEVRSIASIVGEEELGAIEQSYLKFGNRFEHEFIGQGFNEDRSLEESLALGWQDVCLFCLRRNVPASAEETRCINTEEEK